MDRDQRLDRRAASVMPPSAMFWIQLSPLQRGPDGFLAYKVGGRIAVDTNWGCAQARDAGRGGKESKSRDQHAVAAPDIKRHQSEKQGVAAGCHANRGLAVKV